VWSGVTMTAGPGAARAAAAILMSSNSASGAAELGDLVGADEIVLATTAPGPWEDLATGQLLTATAGHRWRFGTVPRIRVLTDLRGNPQNTLLN
jgi:hypothetical protein